MYILKSEISNNRTADLRKAQRLVDALNNKTLKPKHLDNGKWAVIKVGIRQRMVIDGNVCRLMTHEKYNTFHSKKKEKNKK